MLGVWGGPPVPDSQAGNVTTLEKIPVLWEGPPTLDRMAP